MTVKAFVTIASIFIITFLVIAGTIAENINFTAIAVALVSMLGLIWGNPLNRRDGD